MQIVYFFFFWILAVEVAFFLLLTMPTPHGWKGKITKFLTTSPKVKLMMQLLLVICILSGVFFLDSVRTQNRFQKEKYQISHGHSHISSQMRRGWLSYTILKVQRNKYISFMLVYASIGIVLFVHLMNYTYRKRQAFEARMSELKEKQATGQPIKVGEKQPAMSSDTPDSLVDKKNK